jgi:putative SOS response-associated peptidase YedK
MAQRPGNVAGVRHGDNATESLTASITDRRPAILPREAWPIWLGETDGSLADVKALLQTREDGGNWTMAPQHPSETLRPPKPTRQKAQGELF